MLYDFVYRATDHEKNYVAEKWLKDHFAEIKSNFGVDFWDDLMVALSWQSRELCAKELGMPMAF